MLVRDHIAAFGSIAVGRDDDIADLLPQRLPRDSPGVRIALIRRLAGSRQFAFGDRAGVLRTAVRRSGRAFRLDVRQRVVVKARVSRHVGSKSAVRGALAAHLGYLGRSGAGEAAARPTFFDRDGEQPGPGAFVAAWCDDRHHFRLIISPEHGERISDLDGYVRDVMGAVAEDLGEGSLSWLAVCHHDTDQPHAHVLVRGRRADGRDLVIPRDYISYGIRARAQEAAEARLGDLSRQDAEQRVWRETEAERFTSLDRRLVAAADECGRVDDGVGSNTAWLALSRGRLRTLEGLGLAVREGRRFRLDPDLESRLRALQMRRDIVRTLNGRRLVTGRSVAFSRETITGVVMAAGAHDRLGVSRYAIVRTIDAKEVYVRLADADRLPKLGEEVTFGRDASGRQAGLSIDPRGAER